MGLTVNYSFRSKTKTPKAARKIVEKMRQLAMELPFEKVGEIQVIDDPKILNASYDELRGGPYISPIMDAERQVTLPWSRVSYNHPKLGLQEDSTKIDVRPTSIIYFTTLPTEGTESANFGLAQTPTEVEVTYDPEQDRKYKERYTDAFRCLWRFDWIKFHKEHGVYAVSPQHREKRVLKTRAGGWHYGDFCKTVYANNESRGGMPNFLLGHISLVTLIDRIGLIPGVTVEYDDEGNYGPSNFCDDISVPYEERIYSDHPGKYSVKDIAEEVGEWDGTIAPLVFGGSQDPAIEPFLIGLRQTAMSRRTEEPEDE